MIPDTTKTSSQILIAQDLSASTVDQLVVITTGENLLTSGVQIESVLKLCNIRVLGVTQGGIGVDNSGFHKALESHEVLGLSDAV